MKPTRTPFLAAAVAATCAAATLVGPAEASTSAPAASAGTLAAATVLLVPAPQQRRVGTLSVNRSRYVGGQALVWRGNIGARGVRRVRLQLNISRAGDQWTPVAGFSARTKPDGSFRFKFPAPAMADIRYRVVAGRLATRAVLFRAKSQDLTLALVGADTDGRYGTATPGTPFTLAVDTTPTLARRPDTIGLPAFPTRAVTLQRRTATNAWQTIAKSTVDKRGEAQFSGLSVAEAGVVVYRVRQENFTKFGNRIGWVASFPYYVYVGQAPPNRPGGQPFEADGGESGRATTTAAQRNGWGKILYDFGWLRGESLTSPPQRGTQRRAAWSDYADGAGRAAIRNGGLEIVSSRVNAEGPGDFGTTYVTLRRASQKYGRWELRMRSKVIERAQADYRMVAQLVPVSAAVDDCSRTITIAEVDQNGTRLTIGANAGGTRWQDSRKIPSLDTTAPAFAVEVTPEHVTWFMDGQPIGSVRSAAASSGQEMTIRIGLVGGANEAEMNHTSLFNDWVRSFPMGTGREVSAGPALRQGKRTGC